MGYLLVTSDLGLLLRQNALWKDNGGDKVGELEHAIFALKFSASTTALFSFICRTEPTTEKWTKKICKQKTDMKVTATAL